MAVKNALKATERIAQILHLSTRTRTRTRTLIMTKLRLRFSLNLVFTMKIGNSLASNLAATFYDLNLGWVRVSSAVSGKGTVNDAKGGGVLV